MTTTTTIDTKEISCNYHHRRTSSTCVSYNQQQQSRKSNHQHHHSRRYMKGILIVLLIIISESFTVVNAISFWNQFTSTILPKQQYRTTTGSTSTSTSRSGSGSKSTTGSTCTSDSSNYPSSSTSSLSCQQHQEHDSHQQQQHWTQQIIQNTIVRLQQQGPLGLFKRPHCIANPLSVHHQTLTTCRGGHIHHPTLSTVDSILDTATTAAAVVGTPFNLPLNVWKILFQSILTFINVICWYVPLKIHSQQQKKIAAATTTATTTTCSSNTPSENHDSNTNNTNNHTVTSTSSSTTTTSLDMIEKEANQHQYVLSIANAFSGGVFLSLAFGHLIPECIHHYIDSLSTSSSTETNIHTHAITTTPYLFILFGYLLIFFVEKVAFDTHHHHHHHHDDDHDHDTTTSEVTPFIQKEEQEPHHHSMNGSSSTSTSVSTIKPPPPPLQTATTASLPTNTVPVGRSAVILLGALAIHSVLEMMALGLADTFRDGALLTLSIALHQPAESIALLVAFIKSGLSEQQIIFFLSIFSSMGMFGVILGMIVNAYATPIVDSIMLAIVAGTFVYVGATEIIPEEFESSIHKWHKFAALLSGIITIVCITQYTSTLGGGH